MLSFLLQTENLTSAKSLVRDIKLSGLINVSDPVVLSDINDDIHAEIRSILNLNPETKYQIVSIECQSPNFEVGSSRLLSFAKKPIPKDEAKVKAEAVWSIDDMDDDEVDLVNEDELLDEEDRVKPDQDSLRGRELMRFLI